MVPDEGSYGIGSDVWPGLAKFIEEMGELTQVLAKIMAKGGDAGDHWDGKGRLMDRLIEEIGDVEAAMQFFIVINGLPEGRIQHRADGKLQNFHYWQSTQRAAAHG